jgi:hypothetical protein
MDSVNEWNEPIPAWMREKNITMAEVASLLRVAEPDRGNRYAPRSVQTKGEARHQGWIETCRLFATAFGLLAHSQERELFLARCGLTGEATKL